MTTSQTSIFTHCSPSSQSSPSSSSSSRYQTDSSTPKIKNRIVKTYHHDICVSYEGLTSNGDLTLDDSDPDETSRLATAMIPNRHQEYRPNNNKHSMSGVSTIDSGVVSHDSLLDGYKETSVTHSSRSLSPASSRHSTPAPQRHSRGEFDPLNKTNILDARIRNKSRNRLEEQRGKSPCRANSVKQMIQYFEGSSENLYAVASSNGPLPNKGPTITPPLLTPPLLAPTHAKLRVSRSALNGSAITDGSEVVSPATPQKTKQENMIHLTVVASGYSKYDTPSNEQKSNHTSLASTQSLDIDAQEQNTNTTQTINGALHNQPDASVRDISTSASNGHFHESKERSSSNSTNGLINCNRLSSPGLSADDISVEVNGETNPTTINGALDQVDRSVPQTLLENSEICSNQPNTNVKNIKAVSAVEDSPSKKNGEWFLKVTDNAENKLLTLCDVAQKDLDTNTLSDEICGQIRSAIGKAHLLINKKFKQFRGLCNKNLTQGPDEPFPTTSQDLAGFWDMVSIQVQDCESNFEDLDSLRRNGWVQPAMSESDNSNHEITKKPTTPRSQKTMENSLTSESKGRVRPGSKQSATAKAREEARKRLMAAKKAMRERRNSESEDVIYVN